MGREMTVEKKTALLHIDIDSPKTLLRFWGSEGIPTDLESFYDRAMDRAVTFFEKRKLPVTFFCVGEELVSSRAARKWIKEAFRKGHEIANHTYTHPYGLTTLSESAIRVEIQRCSQAIEELTGQRPMGFRAPSYDVDEKVINLLEEMGYSYDTSAAWNVLLPAIKAYHKIFSKKTVTREFGSGSFRIPKAPYFPDANNWRVPQQSPRKILEIPITRSTRWSLPFYNNFHLSAGPIYRNCSFSWMGHGQIVYLMHLIEFVDMTDGLPDRLAVHPNVKKPWRSKCDFLGETLDRIMEKYEPVKTLDYVRHYHEA